MLRTDLLRDKRWGIVALAGAVVLLLWIWAYLPQTPLLTVTFLDVGSGDAIVIRAPGGETALVDAGPSSLSGTDAGERVVLPYLARNGVRTLHAVVLTHPHEDHVGGMASVVVGVDVNMVIDTGAPHGSPGYVKLLETIDKKDIPYHIARRGDEIRLGEVSLRVLNPPTYREGASLNNRSIVLKAQYGNTSFLLTGDAELEAELDMARNCPGLESNVLKVGHHGAATSTSEQFLAAVNPEIAIISVGRNSFGHPSKQTLDRLQRHGVRIYRTDKSGGITIRSDGESLRISTAKSDS